MPYEHHIDRERRLVHVTGRGKVDLFSLLKSIVTVAGDPEFRSDYRVLVDGRDMRGHLSVEELWTVARVLAGLRRSFRQPQAVVVPNLLHYGLACLFSTLGRLFGLRLRAFFAPEEALAWLDAVSAPPARRHPRLEQHPQTGA